MTMTSPKYTLLYPYCTVFNHHDNVLWSFIYKLDYFFKYIVLQVVNGLLVRVLEKAVSGFDFTKTQLTGTVLGFLKRIKKTDS